MGKNKQRDRIRFRHKFLQTIIKLFLWVYFKIAYRYKYDKYKGKRKDIIVIANHVITMDPLFMSMSFDFPLYFIASDQILNLGFVSSIIKWVAAPIAKQKGTSDLQTVKDAYSCSKAGGAIALFPEGNRTYTGKTCTIPSGIGKLIKLLKKPVVVMNFEGGYLSKPRWSSSIRRGKINGKISEIWQPEDYEKLSANEIYNKVVEKLDVDAYKIQDKALQKYHTRKGAEGLENVLYLCPKCKKFHTFIGKGNNYTCQNCGASIKYNNLGYFEPKDDKINFKILTEWFDWQNNYVKDNKLWDNHYDKPIMSSKTFKLYKSIRAKNIFPLGQGELECYSNRFVFKSKKPVEINFDDILTIAPQMTKKIVIYLKSGETLVLHGSTRSYALSYILMFFIIKNTKEENNNAFLGL